MSRFPGICRAALLIFLLLGVSETYAAKKKDTRTVVRKDAGRDQVGFVLSAGVLAMRCPALKHR
eukprot:174031-Rhodomonas_salina.1